MTEHTGTQKLNLDRGVEDVVNDLTRHIDFNMFRNEKDITVHDNVMSRKRKAWHKYDRKCDSVAAEVLRDSLEKLRDDLEILENENKRLYNSLISKWENGRKYENYLGIRFEIEIAAEFTREGIDFQEVDPPDFCISTCGAQMELTTIRSEENNTAPEEINFRSSLREKIRNKLNSYTDIEESKAVLLVDVTNLFAHAINRGCAPELSSEIEYAFNEFNLKNWGSLIIVNHAGDKNNNFRSYHVRADSPNINSEVRTFLDTIFPIKGNHFEKKTILLEP